MVLSTWRPVKVELPETAEEIDLLTYVVSQRQTSEFLPSRAYLEQILTGARHWKLPVAYIEMLTKIRTKD